MKRIAHLLLFTACAERLTPAVTLVQIQRQIFSLLLRTR